MIFYYQKGGLKNMKQKIIMHTQISLDGRIKGFDNPEVYYQVAGGIHSDAVLFGSNTVFTAFEKYPAETEADFEKIITSPEDPDSDLAYLKNEIGFEEEFLEYLRNWKFRGTIRSMREGEIAFAEEPLMQVEGPILDCQIIETALLNVINYQTLIATKASKVKTAAEGDVVMEFGARRAQEMDASLWGARAAYIGGVESTSNTRASKVFGIPASGTHAHALVQAYRDEY